MSGPKRVEWSLEEFLIWEVNQPERYEFVDGAPRMMTAVGVTLGLHEIYEGLGVFPAA